MPAGPTYEPIATTTLGSAAASYTFSSIPSTYTDLILVAVARSERNEQSGRPSDILLVTCNGATTNYSYTMLGSNNSTAISYRETSMPYIPLAFIPGEQSTSGQYSTSILQFQAYKNTTNFKTVLGKGGNGTGVTGGNIYMSAAVGLWRDSSAINSIRLAPQIGPNFVAGSTFTLYGITAA